MANDYELSYTAEQIDERLGKAGNAVLHTEQNLDDQQKARARENIGAASSENVMNLADYTEEHSYAITPTWERARLSDGIFNLVPTITTNVAAKEFYKVTPNVVYRWTFKMSATHSVSLYINWYENATEGSYIDKDAIYNKYPDQDGVVSATSVMPSNANYVRFALYYGGVDDMLPDSITPRDSIFHPAHITDAVGYRTIKTDRLKVKEIFSVMVSLGLINGGEIIPDYYLATGYLTNKCNRVNELYSACAGDGDAFVFVTDQHWTKNAQKSPALIRYLVDETNVPRVFSGGDMENGAAKEYPDAMRTEVDRPTHYVMGNHDFFDNADGNPLCHIFHSGKENQIGPASKCYFYVDNRQCKIRYIILNSFRTDSAGSVVSAYDNDQIAWLTNTALDVEDGWTVIVFTHSLYYGSGTAASLQPSPDRADEIVTALDAATCDIACVIQGHMHLDRITHTPGGIPVVATTCDKYVPWIDGETDMEPWITESRTEGTITEQAFDVVVLDKTARRLTFVRIGAPADNWIDGVTTGTVEERVVAY